MLEFLTFQLQRLNAFNTMFQTNLPMLHRLSDEVHKLLKETLFDFIQIEVVKQSDPFEVDIYSSKSRVKIDDVYLGLSATITMTLSECCE